RASEEKQTDNTGAVRLKPRILKNKWQQTPGPHRFWRFSLCSLRYALFANADVALLQKRRIAFGDDKGDRKREERYRWSVNRGSTTGVGISHAGWAIGPEKRVHWMFQTRIAIAGTIGAGVTTGARSKRCWMVIGACIMGRMAWRNGSILIC